MTNHYENVTKN